jgi:hypothetical protein
VIDFWLYFLTGLATGGLVLYTLSWGIWGAPTSPLEFVSLLGSVFLIVAAVVSQTNRKRAGRIALCAMVMIWSFYAPAIFQSGRSVLTNQQLTVKVIKWRPATSGPLVNRQAEDSMLRLSATEWGLLEQAKLQGAVWGESSTSVGKGAQAEVLLVMQYPVVSKVELPQPKGGTLVYIQTENGWRSWPESGLKLKRTIRLEPYREDSGLSSLVEEQANQTFVSVEQSNGSLQGFGVSWEKDR